MRNLFHLLVVTAVVMTLSVKVQLVIGLSSPPPPPLSVTKSNIKKATTAASTSAYRRKNQDHNNNNIELETQVITSIQSVVSSLSNITQNPQIFFTTLCTFGKSSGSLISQKWLTPESLEECTVFWDDGYRALMRDLFRSYLFSRESTRYEWRDWVALGWFGVLASSSSILFLPLLLPLIKVALEDVGEDGINESTYVPPSFGSKRLMAMRRLRRPNEQPLSRYLANGTPRNAQEGISFFRDGTLLLVRDIKRGALTSREDDNWGSYAWFTFLAFSSFPITPLIIPLIDKRRNGENDATSDYVPSSYRPERLRALKRLRDIKAFQFGITAVDVLRAVGSVEEENRPPPEMVLEAILKTQRQSRKQDKSVFLENLAGVPGRQWELAYVAGKSAVDAMRKQQLQDSNNRSSTNDGHNDEKSGGISSSDSWYRPLERLLLPWTRLRDGLYIDSNLVSAIQNFDVQTMQNKNGVFQILKSDFFQTTVEGPFSWDGDCRTKDRLYGQAAVGDGNHPKRNKNAAVCAFRPIRATYQLGPWKIDQDIPEDKPFDQTHIRDLPFFRFIHVDDRVAVALGRSGGVALWVRMAEY